MDNFQIETAQNVSIRQNTAGVVSRVLAYLIDALIIGVYEFSVQIMIATLGLDGMKSWVYILVMGLPLLLYFLLWETFWDGRTPGKAALQLRVVKLDGSKPTFSNYLIRWLLRFIDISLSMGGVAIVTILFNGKGQRLGDIAATTAVISEKNRVKFSEMLMVEVPENYTPTYPQVTIFKDEEMQQIKSLFRESRYKGNYQVIISLSEKVAEVMEVTPTERPADFLNTVLMDFNYYTQQA